MTREAVANGVVNRITAITACSEAQMTRCRRFRIRMEATARSGRPFRQSPPGIAGANADGRRAGRVRCMNHPRTARGQDQLDRRMTHQLVGELYSRLVDPSICLRSARRYRCSSTGALPRKCICAPRVGLMMIPFRVFRLNQRFENRRRGWIRGWDDAANQTHGLAIVIVPASSSWLRMPQVFSSL